MPAHRFYLDAPFQVASTLDLSGEELAHLHVMRPHLEDQIELINGKGALATATLQTLSKAKATLKLISVTEEPPPHRVILAQALLKKNKLDWLIEKGSELNISEFWFYPTLFSERQASPDLDRMHKLAIAATKQCGRLYLPSFKIFTSLQEIQLFPSHVYFGDTSPQAPYFSPPPQDLPYLLFIGPEQGFAKQEIDFLKHHFKATGIKLHPNILRAETASLAMTCIVQHYVNAPRLSENDPFNPRT